MLWHNSSHLFPGPAIRLNVTCVWQNLLQCKKTYGTLACTYKTDLETEARSIYGLLELASYAKRWRKETLRTTELSYKQMLCFTNKLCFRLKLTLHLQSTSFSLLQQFVLGLVLGTLRQGAQDIAHAKDVLIPRSVDQDYYRPGSTNLQAFLAVPTTYRASLLIASD